MMCKMPKNGLFICIYEPWLYFSGHWWRGAGLQVNTFDLVSRDDYQLSLAGEGGCPGLMSRRGSVEGRGRSPGPMFRGGKGHGKGGMLGPQVWCPGGRWYTTIWPIPWCTWCTYPLLLGREWLIDRYLWKNYLPVTLFAVGKNQVCYFVTGFVLFFKTCKSIHFCTLQHQLWWNFQTGELFRNECRWLCHFFVATIPF